MTKRMSAVVEAILEMTNDQLRSGLIDKAEHKKITFRHMGSRGLGMFLPKSGEEIRRRSDRASCGPGGQIHRQ